MPDSDPVQAQSAEGFAEARAESRSDGPAPTPPQLPASSRRQWLTHGLGAVATLALTGWAGWTDARAATLPGRGAGAERPRLAVVMLRGALDGLAAVPPVGDPALAGLRGSATPDPAGPPLPLDSNFALHPGLSTLHGWFGDRQLMVVHAVAGPYRERSHFDAQQLLESGSRRPFEFSSGFLGRALALKQAQGLALGASLPLALRGADGASTWAAGRTRPVDDDMLERVSALYAADPALQRAFSLARAQRQGAMASAMGEVGTGQGAVDTARQAGRWLADPNGPAVVWMDSNGWDTHTQQNGRLARLLPQLDQSLAALRLAIGAAWAHTTVLVLTEFGRSATLNGSGGTDHGTGTVAFIAGGRVAGGRVLADWPGLAHRNLLDGRDLHPTIDLRAILAPVLQHQFGLTDSQLDRDVLPGAGAVRRAALEIYT